MTEYLTILMLLSLLLQKQKGLASLDQPGATTSSAASDAKQRASFMPEEIATIYADYATYTIARVCAMMRHAVSLNAQVSAAEVALAQVLFFFFIISHD